MKTTRLGSKVAAGVSRRDGKLLKWFAVVVLAASALIGSTAATATIVSSISGVVTAGVTDLHFTTDEHSANFTGAPVPLNAKAAISVLSGSDIVAGDASVDADWTSPDEGTVKIDLDGEIQKTPSCCGLAIYTDVGLDPNWSYAFNATSDAVFHLTSAITGSGLGAGGFRFYINDVLATTLIQTGEQNYDLIGGQTYTLSIINFSGFSTTGGTYSFTNSGLFQFEILPPDLAVPEPATWLVLLTGLALASCFSFPRRRLER